MSDFIRVTKSHAHYDPGSELLINADWIVSVAPVEGCERRPDGAWCEIEFQDSDRKISVKHSLDEIEDKLAVPIDPRTRPAPLQVIDMDGKVHIDFTQSVPNYATVRSALRRRPTGFVFSLDAPDALLRELISGGYEVRNVLRGLPLRDWSMDEKIELFQKPALKREAMQHG